MSEEEKGYGSKIKGRKRSPLTIEYRAGHEKDRKKRKKMYKDYYDEKIATVEKGKKPGHKMIRFKRRGDRPVHTLDMTGRGDYAEWTEGGKGPHSIIKSSYRKPIRSDRQRTGSYKPPSLRKKKK